jgi:hypothetical protein
MLTMVTWVNHNGVLVLQMWPLSTRTKSRMFTRMHPHKIIPTSDQLDILTDMAGDGARRQDIADAMGISKRSLARLVISDEFPEIKQAYLAAKQAYAADLAEDVMVQASAPLHDNPKLANAEVQRRRLIVDTSKWIASKLLPKVYGDNLKINHEHSGEIKLSPLAQLRQLESKGPIIDVPSPAVIHKPVTVDDCF